MKVKLKLKSDERKKNSNTPDAGVIKFATMLAEIILSGDKQNVIVLIEAKPGFGKSYAALDLAVWTAIELARLQGKHPPWYYFNMNHVAIINSDEIVRVIEEMKQFGIYIFDDFGVGYSARDWQSDGNKAMNSMLETIRTDNNILIMTVPDSEWIDKVGRNIIHFKIYMSEKLFKLGRTVGKLTTEEKQYNSRSRAVYHKYIRTKKEIYNKVLFCFPPKNVADEYDRRRAIELDKLKEESKELYKAAKNNDAKNVSNPKQESLFSQVEMFTELKSEGMVVRKIGQEIKKKFGDISYSTKYLNDYAHEHGML